MLKVNVARRTAVINEARQWLGTPYHHQASLKGVGCDCIGLIKGVGDAFGLMNIPDNAWTNIKRYSRRPNPVMMGNHLETYMDRISSPLIGDIAWIEWRQDLPMHLALVAEKNGVMTFIHAYSLVGKAVEVCVDDEWLGMVNSWWRYRGID